MSYSSLTNKYIPASADNYMRGRGGYKVCKITPHHMACQWTAERCAQSFQVSGRMASANYCIGSDGTIVSNVDRKTEHGQVWNSTTIAKLSQLKLQMKRVRLIGLSQLKHGMHW